MLRARYSKAPNLALSFFLLFWPIMEQDGKTISVMNFVITRIPLATSPILLLFPALARNWRETGPIILTRDDSSLAPVRMISMIASHSTVPETF